MKKIFLSLLLLLGLVFVPFSGEINVEAYSLKDAVEEHANAAGTETKEMTPSYLPVSGAVQGGNATDITSVVQKILGVITGLAAAIAIIFVVYNSVILVISTGDTDRISTAKKGLIWSAVGLVLIIFAYIIVKTIVHLTYSGQGVDAVDNKVPKEATFDFSEARPASREYVPEEAKQIPAPAPAPAAPAPAAPAKPAPEPETPAPSRGGGGVVVLLW